MEKTIEEQWQAVKEFLLAKMGDNDGDDEGVSWDSDCGTWEAYWWKPNWKMKLELVDSRVSEVLLTDHPSHLQTANIPVLYSLLGLDKRDALEAERGKSAKLVKALTKIRKMRKTDRYWDGESMTKIAALALEAYKEGKKDE